MSELFSNIKLIDSFLILEIEINSILKQETINSKRSIIYNTQKDQFNEQIPIYSYERIKIEYNYLLKLRLPEQKDHNLDISFENLYELMPIEYIYYLSIHKKDTSFHKEEYLKSPKSNSINNINKFSINNKKLFINQTVVKNKKSFNTDFIYNDNTNTNPNINLSYDKTDDSIPLFSKYFSLIIPNQNGNGTYKYVHLLKVYEQEYVKVLKSNALVPKYLIFISDNPFFISFKMLLEEIYLNSIPFGKLKFKLETFLSIILYQTYLPKYYSTQLSFNLGFNNFNFSRNPFHNEISFKVLLSYLTIDRIVILFISLLLNSKIIFFHSQIEAITPIIYSLISLLYPFTTGYNIISNLNSSLIDVLENASSNLIVCIYKSDYSSKEIEYVLSKIHSNLIDLVYCDLDNNQVEVNYNEQFRKLDGFLYGIVISLINKLKLYLSSTVYDNELIMNFKDADEDLFLFRNLKDHIHYIESDEKENEKMGKLNYKNKEKSKIGFWEYISDYKIFGDIFQYVNIKNMKNIEKPYKTKTKNEVNVNNEHKGSILNINHKDHSSYRKSINKNNKTVIKPDGVILKNSNIYTNSNSELLNQVNNQTNQGSLLYKYNKFNYSDLKFQNEEYIRAVFLEFLISFFENFNEDKHFESDNAYYDQNNQSFASRTVTQVTKRTSKINIKNKSLSQMTLNTQTDNKQMIILTIYDKVFNPSRFLQDSKLENQFFLKTFLKTSTFYIFINNINYLVDKSHKEELIKKDILKNNISSKGINSKILIKEYDKVYELFMSLINIYKKESYNGIYQYIKEKSIIYNSITIPIMLVKNKREVFSMTSIFSDLVNLNDFLLNSSLEYEATTENSTPFKNDIVDISKQDVLSYNLKILSDDILIFCNNINNNDLNISQNDLKNLKDDSKERIMLIKESVNLPNTSSNVNNEKEFLRNTRTINTIKSTEPQLFSNNNNNNKLENNLEVKDLKVSLINFQSNQQGSNFNFNKNSKISLINEFKKLVFENKIDVFNFFNFKITQSSFDKIPSYGNVIMRNDDKEKNIIYNMFINLSLNIIQTSSFCYLCKFPHSIWDVRKRINEQDTLNCIYCNSTFTPYIISVISDVNDKFKGREKNEEKEKGSTIKYKKIKILSYSSLLKRLIKSSVEDKSIKYKLNKYELRLSKYDYDLFFNILLLINEYKIEFSTLNKGNLNTLLKQPQQQSQSNQFLSNEINKENINISILIENIYQFILRKDRKIIINSYINNNYKQSSSHQIRTLSTIKEKKGQNLLEKNFTSSNNNNQMMMKNVSTNTNVNNESISKSKSKINIKDMSSMRSKQKSDRQFRLKNTNNEKENKGKSNKKVINFKNYIKNNELIIKIKYESLLNSEKFEELADEILSLPLNLKQKVVNSLSEMYYIEKGNKSVLKYKNDYYIEKYKDFEIIAGKKYVKKNEMIESNENIENDSRNEINFQKNKKFLSSILKNPTNNLKDYFMLIDLMTNKKNKCYSNENNENEEKKLILNSISKSKSKEKKNLSKYASPSKHDEKVLVIERNSQCNSNTSLKKINKKYMFSNNINDLTLNSYKSNKRIQFLKENLLIEGLDEEKEIEEMIVLKGRKKMKEKKKEYDDNNESKDNEFLNNIDRILFKGKNKKKENMKSNDKINFNTIPHKSQNQDGYFYNQNDMFDN